MNETLVITIKKSESSNIYIPISTNNLTEKLKALKAHLRAWNKNSFGRVEVKKKALKKVKEWDDLDVQRPQSMRERE